MPQPTDPEPPSGAEADIWLDAGYRDVYQTIGMVSTCDDVMRCPLVTATARQHHDGQLSNAAVEVDDAGHEPLTADQARDLAFMIISAAHTVDRWNGIDNDPALLDNYFHGRLTEQWSGLSARLMATADELDGGK